CGRGCQPELHRDRRGLCTSDVNLLTDLETSEHRWIDRVSQTTGVAHSGGCGEADHSRRRVPRGDGDGGLPLAGGGCTWRSAWRCRRRGRQDPIDLRCTGRMQPHADAIGVAHRDHIAHLHLVEARDARRHVQGDDVALTATDGDGPCGLINSLNRPLKRNLIANSILWLLSYSNRRRRQEEAHTTPHRKMFHHLNHLCDAREQRRIGAPGADLWMRIAKRCSLRTHDTRLTVATI